MNDRTALRPGLGAAPMLAVALVWSWTWWAVSIATGGTETPAGGIAWILGGFGPVVAVVLALRRSPQAYRSDLWSRLTRWRVAPVWLLATVLIASGPKLVAMGVARLGGHVAAGEAISVASIPISVAFTLIVVWIEEPLWRGVALDAFGVSWVRASLLIGVVWSAWHVPLFAVAGTWQHGLGFGTADFWIFSVAVVGLSVLLTWLVVSSGSVLLALVGHGLINLTGELLPDDTTIRAIEAMVIWIAAAGALVALRARRLSLDAEVVE